MLCPKNQSLASAQEESKESCIADKDIFPPVRKEVLAGAYHLLDYKGYADYKEGDNVIHIFAMGAPATCAIEASENF